MTSDRSSIAPEATGTAGQLPTPPVDSLATVIASSPDELGCLTAG